MSETSNHIGRKISRIRELRGLKQEALAAELGVSQQAISKLEQSDRIEADVLDKVAKALGVTAEEVKNYSDDAVINYFNNFYDNSGSGAYGINCTFNFNPIDKLIEEMEANKKLYERLLSSEREKVELLKGTRA